MIKLHSKGKLDRFTTHDIKVKAESLQKEDIIREAEKTALIGAIAEFGFGNWGLIRRKTKQIAHWKIEDFIAKAETYGLKEEMS